MIRNKKLFKASRITSRPPKNDPVPAGICCSDTHSIQYICLRLLPVAMRKITVCRGERPKKLTLVSIGGELNPEAVVRPEADPRAKIK